MRWIDELCAMSPEHRVRYAWARAVEWERFPAFVSQPIVPPLFVLIGWKRTLLGILVVNFLWNLVFCSAVISLRLSTLGMIWAKLKWFSVLGFGVYFAASRQWALFGLTLAVPILIPFLSELILRHPTKVIQEFLLLPLGLAHGPQSPEVVSYLKKIHNE
jgi:hypothetical protein